MKIIILDTGCSNISSIFEAIKRLGYISKISNKIENILNADKLILPGVGTAKSAMNKIKKNNLLKIIKNIKQPTLGICLGMQLLSNFSEENKIVKMLSIINNSTKKIKSKLPIPHMGWNTINFNNTNHLLLKNIPNKSYFYFAHSYFMSICSETVAYTKYEIKFSAIIEKNNFFGVQFHPERSGKIGSKLLKNFLEI